MNLGDKVRSTEPIGQDMAGQGGRIITGIVTKLYNGGYIDVTLKHGCVIGCHSSVYFKVIKPFQPFVKISI